MHTLHTAIFLRVQRRPHCSVFPRYNTVTVTRSGAGQPGLVVGLFARQVIDCPRVGQGVTMATALLGQVYALVSQLDEMRPVRDVIGKALGNADADGHGLPVGAHTEARAEQPVHEYLGAGVVGVGQNRHEFLAPPNG